MDQEEAKIAWGNDMRRQFSPAGVSLEDGSINQDYFKPKRIIIQLTEAKRWGEPEKAALLKGIEKHGVGKWRDIIEERAELSRCGGGRVCQTQKDWGRTGMLERRCVGGE